MSEYRIRFKKGDMEFEISSHELDFVKDQFQYFKQYFNLPDLDPISPKIEDKKDILIEKKVLHLTYTDTERRIMKEAKGSNNNCFEAHITLMQGCIMKSLRITLLLRSLEKHCDIIKVYPPFEEIESEKMGDVFILALISKVSPETIRDVILSISEIATAETFNIELDNSNKTVSTSFLNEVIPVSPSLAIHDEPAQIKVKKNISIKDLVNLKQPTTFEDYVIVTSYYLDKYEYKTEFTEDEIVDFLNKVETVPLELENYIESNIKKGFLRKASDIDGIQKYSLTFSGEKYVKDGLV